MFFSVELLSKRDSGFGLLWLAATLGSKSSFSKLPKRSIQTADIPQLCGLISHPTEPLALRLSSNLMVGVARVYKIKHEIFMSDISNCFTLLKKAIQEIHSLGALSEAQLQMGQPSVRPDALTLAADPLIAVAFELDVFDANWNDISGYATQRNGGDDGDDEDFTLNGKSKSKARPKQSLILTEAGRTGLHTLDEHHEYLLSTSFEANGSFMGNIDPSSSQIEPGMHFGSYMFDDNIFNAGDQLDLGIDDIGDDLARELGEGWGVDVQNPASDIHMDVDQQPNFMMDGEVEAGFGGFDHNTNVDYRAASDDGKTRTLHGRKRPFADSDKENMPPSSVHGSAEFHSSVHDTSAVQTPGHGQADVPELVQGDNTKIMPVPRRAKKVRILLDIRTELTDEELKAAREKYVEGQRAIRFEIGRKRMEKESERVLEDIIWGVPEGLTAPALANFWSEIYKKQVESRSGAVRLDDQEKEPRYKRRKLIHDSPCQDDEHPVAHNVFSPGDMGADYDFGGMQGDYDAPVNFDDPSRIRSSEEPERGRNATSRISSALGFDAEVLNPSSGTQRSAFFPWDNAAGTSSTGAGFVPSIGRNSDRLSMDNADVRIVRSRSRSRSRRGSFSIVPSQVGSLTGLEIGLSPVHGSGNDFRFDVTNDKTIERDADDGLKNTVALERTSYNFLEYCKMQVQTLPGNQSSLDFGDVVPSATSSSRVASAAFYHCLVLATKDLVIIRQNEAYGSLTIKIK